MKVAIIQPNYIPWKGYFDIINDVDIFVFLDDVQYTDRDWRNRNQIKTQDGLKWLSVPVQRERNQTIQDIKIDNKNGWVHKHLETIRHAYAKSKFMNDNFHLMECCLQGVNTHLAALNFELIQVISNFLDIQTEFLLSSDLKVAGKKGDRLIRICKEINADCYLSGPSAQSYLFVDQFESESIQVEYKDYRGYPEYPQLFSPFEHHVSILDLIFNVGPEASHFIWGWRTTTP